MPNQPKNPITPVRLDDELRAAVKAEAEKRGVSVAEVIRAALRQMLFTAPLFALFVGAMLWGGHVTVVHSQAQQDAYRADNIAAADAMVHEQARALGCTIAKPTLTDRVAVRPAGTVRAGTFDTGVVSVVSFDEALAQAKAGTVWVVAYCG